MTPEDQAEYDALPWERRVWTEQDDQEAYGEYENAGGSVDCVACGKMIEVGDAIALKQDTIDVWHEDCAPPQSMETGDWPRRVLSFTEAVRDYPELMARVGILFPGMNGDSRAGVVSLVVDTCGRCCQHNGDMTHEDN
jgi:hypothetical protein